MAPSYGISTLIAQAIHMTWIRIMEPRILRCESRDLESVEKKSFCARFSSQEMRSLERMGRVVLILLCFAFVIGE